MRTVIKVLFHLREAMEEEFFAGLVPVIKFTQHLTELARDFILRESHDASDNPPRDIFAGRPKRTHQYPRAVRDQGWPDAFGVDGGGFQNEPRLRGDVIGRTNGFCIS
jgi:hypothetical protein